MGGNHKDGVKITLNSLLDKQNRLAVRISKMFKAYAEGCKHHKSYNKCEHPCNEYPPSFKQHYMCTVDRCPDAHKI